VGWFKPDGTEMNDSDWDPGFARSVGLFLNGEAIHTPDERGQRVVDDSFLLVFNAHNEPLAWTLPLSLRGRSQVAADTTVPREAWGGTIEDSTTLPARSLRVLQFRPDRNPIQWLQSRGFLGT
jgi:glycogen operon protein